MDKFVYFTRENEFQMTMEDFGQMSFASVVFGSQMENNIQL